MDFKEASEVLKASRELTAAWKRRREGLFH
jgi:hypothetical protein